MFVDGKLLHKLRTTVKFSAEHYDYCCAILDIINSEVRVSFCLSEMQPIGIWLNELIDQRLCTH
jgi:hypothetical protein